MTTGVALEDGEAARVLMELPDPLVVLTDEGGFRFCNASFMQAIARAGAAHVKPHELAGMFGIGREDAPLEGEATIGEVPYRYRRTRIEETGWLCFLQPCERADDKTEADEAAGANAVAEGEGEAARDELTGLLSRGTLVRTLTQAADHRPADAAPLAVLMIDLDRFKAVNDTLGHGVGDALLSKVAERLRASVRAGDMLARYGGDEFVVLQQGQAQPAAAEALAERIVDLVARPYIVDGQMVEIGASVGVSLLPGDAASADDAMRQADVALYRAKEEGGSGHRFFEEGMDRAMRERRDLDREMRRALAYRQFALHYQPLFDTKSGRVASLEALVRWQHPERGLIQPAEFVSLAEETGFIVPLGEWVVRQACEDLARWPEDVSVAVNVSARQLTSPNLVATVQGALAAHGITPDRFEIEVTESVIMGDETACLETLFALRECGIRIALDDFGTGYSSISYLRKFPFSKIKIDRSFLSGEEAERGASLVRAIVDIGRHFEMDAVAEGVETVDQASAMEALGCQSLQGFLFSRPIAGVDVPQVIEAIAGRGIAEAPGSSRPESDAPTLPETEEGLVRLVYTSHNRMDALERDVEGAVASILEASRRNNRANRITGALLYTGGQFAQVLEGPAAAVEATFERIQLDDRHSAVNLVEYGPVETRSFGEWCMADAGIDPGRVRVAGVTDLAEIAARGGASVVSVLTRLLRDEERNTLAA